MSLIREGIGSMRTRNVLRLAAVILLGGGLLGSTPAQAAPTTSDRVAALSGLVDRIDPAVAGTAWSVDPAADRIVVTVDSTVTGAAFGQVQAAVARAGGHARIERTSGTFTPL